jgi:hypothetical protein
MHAFSQLMTELVSTVRIELISELVQHDRE